MAKYFTVFFKSQKIKPEREISDHITLHSVTSGVLDIFTAVVCG